VPEPNFAHDAWTAEATDAVSWTQALGARPATEQLTLRLDDRRSQESTEALAPLPDALTQAAIDLAYHRQRWEHEHEALLAELLHLRTHTQEQVDRIFNLEQALDQSLELLNGLRQQLVDQDFLEQQLASTEEISNVQQQAITRLKQQLSQQQAVLEAQLLESQLRDQALQDLLTTLETLIQTQQGELEGLRQQLGHDRASTQSRQSHLEQQIVELRAALEMQQSGSAPSLALSLETWLDESFRSVQALLEQSGAHQPACQELHASLQQLRIALQEQRLEAPRLVAAQAPEVSLPASPPDQDEIGAHWAQDLAVAQGKIEELETQIAKQLTTEARFQHACQELEAERDRQQLRLTELERQTADMQEQILQQAQQSSEYETAVQHWKDRYLQGCNQIQQIKAFVEQQMLNPPPELVRLLEALPPGAGMPEVAIPTHRVTPLNQTAQIDLPDFLLRRRNKARRS
jgi:hypothetical protein